MSKSTLPLLVALTPSTKALLRERAQEEGRSMTTVVEDALRAYITDPTGHDLTVTPSAAGYERTVFYVEAALIQPLRNYALIRGASLHRLVEGVIRAHLSEQLDKQEESRGS